VPRLKARTHAKRSCAFIRRYPEIKVSVAVVETCGVVVAVELVTPMTKTQCLKID
jgi:hypothetical protein